VGFRVVGISTEDPESRGILRSYFANVLGASADSSAAKWINYPTLAYSPETSWEIGVSSLYVYSANRDLHNRLSEIKSFAFVTLENQYGFWLDHALYTDQNKWFLYGRARYQSFPLFYYGIGRDSPPEVQSVIDGDYLLIRERVLRETLPSLYVGLELDYQQLSRIEYVSTAPDFVLPSLGNEGSSNLGVGAGVLYDNIHNALNPREGLYSELAFLHYNTELASDFNFTTFIVDNRIYRSLRENTVLAAQAYGQFTSERCPLICSLLWEEKVSCEAIISAATATETFLAPKSNTASCHFPFQNGLVLAYSWLRARFSEMTGRSRGSIFYRRVAPGCGS